MSLLKTKFGRVALDVFFFVSILVAPWGFSLLVGLVALAIFDDYYELILGAFVVDALYGKNFDIQGQLVVFMTTLGALILVLVARPIKKRLIFYES